MQGLAEIFKFIKAEIREILTEEIPEDLRGYFDEIKYDYEELDDDLTEMNKNKKSISSIVLFCQDRLDEKEDHRDQSDACVLNRLYLISDLAMRIKQVFDRGQGLHFYCHFVLLMLRDVQDQCEGDVIIPATGGVEALLNVASGKTTIILPDQVTDEKRRLICIGSRLLCISSLLVRQGVVDALQQSQAQMLLRSIIECANMFNNHEIITMLYNILNIIAPDAQREGESASALPVTETVLSTQAEEYNEMPLHTG